MSERIHVKHRDTARVLVYTPENEVLLLKTHFDPEVQLPPRWLIPGGGIDEGETAEKAAVRELFEETGLTITVDDLGPIVMSTSGRWDWGDGVSYHTYTDIIFEYQTPKFELNTQGFTQDELRDVLEYRWWNVAELIASGESIGPHELKKYLASRFINNR
jgi:8-oxo-dGTP pyrophosphatase MutT (NUDIX family)